MRGVFDRVFFAPAAPTLPIPSRGSAPWTPGAGEFGCFGASAGAGPSWLVAQFPAPLKSEGAPPDFSGARGTARATTNPPAVADAPNPRPLPRRREAGRTAPYFAGLLRSRYVSMIQPFRSRASARSRSISGAVSAIGPDARISSGVPMYAPQ